MSKRPTGDDVCRESQLRVISYRSLKDQGLVAAWEAISSKESVFEQLSYGWAKAWLAHLGAETEPYVLVAMDKSAAVQGIASFGIEKIGPWRALRFLPSSFADFHDLVVHDDVAREDVEALVADHIASFGEWDLVVLDQVSERSSLARALTKRGFHSTALVECVDSDLRGRDWRTYSREISRNMRHDFEKKARSFAKLPDARVEVFSTRTRFDEFFPWMQTLYGKRWKDDYKMPFLSEDAAAAFVREAVGGAFDKGRGRLLAMFVGRQPIAYRLMFSQGGTLYDWNTGFDPTWAQLSPGKLSIGFAIQYALDQRLSRFHFMAGGYQYKRQWSNIEEAAVNLRLFKGSDTVAGRILETYYAHLREQLQRYYHGMLSSGVVRRISRTIRR